VLIVNILKFNDFSFVVVVVVKLDDCRQRQRVQACGFFITDLSLYFITIDRFENVFSALRPATGKHNIL